MLAFCEGSLKYRSEASAVVGKIDELIVRRGFRSF